MSAMVLGTAALVVLFAGVAHGFSATPTPAASKLRALLQREEILVMPCCYDGLTAKLVEQAGFPLTFMTGFGVSASFGMPDTQLISYGEMVQRASEITSMLRSIPCIGDGDTGYGGPINAKRTVAGYAQAGLAGIMIEDQVSPKKCGHTKGKSVVSRDEAVMRVRAACDARDEGSDIVVMARTDARGCVSMDEAIARCLAFKEAGADITFLEAPQSVEEMERYCHEVPGPKLANMLEYGKTPILPPKDLQAMGYTIAAYPLSLLGASIKAMQMTLQKLSLGEPVEDMLVDFKETQRVVGFPEYYEQEDRYKI